MNPVANHGAIRLFHLTILPFHVDQRGRTCRIPSGQSITSRKVGRFKDQFFHSSFGA